MNPKVKLGGRRKWQEMSRVGPHSSPEGEIPPEKMNVNGRCQSYPQRTREDMTKIHTGCGIPLIFRLPSCWYGCLLQAQITATLSWLDIAYNVHTRIRIVYERASKVKGHYV